jgi:PTS system fructose-specific IIA component/PTS system nitrogen regulatory IIA component
MKLENYLRKDKILLDLKAENKEEAIEEIALVLKNSKGVLDFDQFFTDILDREKLKTTGIGKGIAIPHARSESVDRFLVAFGRVRQGIDFDSLDNQPTKLIFLMGTPKNKEVGSYLKILTYLTRLLDKESFRNVLLEVEKPKDVIEEFRRAKKY